VGQPPRVGSEGRAVTTSQEDKVERSPAERAALMDRISSRFVPLAESVAASLARTAAGKVVTGGHTHPDADRL